MNTHTLPYEQLDVVEPPRSITEQCDRMHLARMIADYGPVWIIERIAEMSGDGPSTAGAPNRG